MAFILGLPSIIKIFLILGIIVGALKIKIPLWVSLLMGGVFLSFLFSMSAFGYFKAAYTGTVSFETINLIVVIVGILILSNTLSISGRLDRIVISFKKIVGESRISLVTFPALIGLLPMPGGAVFSAPMVGAITDKSDLSPTQKTVINYWFRHIWEYWYPLYPGAILAILLSKIPTYKFMIMNFPMTFAALGAGYLIILHKISLSDKKYRNYSRQNIKDFLIQLLPILIVISSLLILGIAFSQAEKLFKFKSPLLEKIPILIGLVLSFSWIVYSDKLEWKKIKPVFFKKSIYEMAFLVLGLMIFKKVLGDSGAIESIKDELLEYKIPMISLIMALPFIAGFVTGIAVGFVGVSYPIVISLIATLQIPVENCGHLFFIAYVSGFTGMMLSPVHLCLLLTKDYFKSGMLSIYMKYLIPISLLALLPSFLLFYIYKIFQI